MKTTTNSCPCCDRPLLRHVRHRGVYWFCQSCWQEVPLLSISRPDSLIHRRIRQRPISSQLILT
ncbi:MAG: hypothetical protein F6K28_43945 [Microcoleus sp. SIO2G3]|nr:hypothetical protein [Microcoleus sp. SIO2G3]